MIKKDNYLGFILIFIGAILLIQKFLDISILNSLLWIILGVSLLSIYKSKDEKWAMPLGIIATYLGLSKILVEFDIISHFARFTGAFPFIIAFILIVLFFEKKYLSLFNIGIIFLSFGVSAFATSIKFSYIFLSFNITLMIGLFTGYILSGKKSKLNLYFGIFYAFLVLKGFISNTKSIISIPVFLILMGLVLCFSGRRKNLEQNQQIIDTRNNQISDNFNN